MSAAMRWAVIALAAPALATSVAVASGPATTHALVPVPLPTIDLGTPLPTLDLRTPLPTVGLGTPLPTLDLGTPLPTIDLGSPLPTIDLGSPLPSTIAVPSSDPSPTQNFGDPPPPSEPSVAPSSIARPRPPLASDDAGVTRRSGVPRPDEDPGRPTSVKPSRPEIPEIQPPDPALSDVGSWLLPALGAGVPALIAAAIVAAQVAGGAVGIRLARRAMGRLAVVVRPGNRSPNAR